jgi:hypothetical protein
MSSYLDVKYLDLYLRGFTSTIFALSGAVKASGALTEKMKPFGYPKYFPEALGLFEVILAVVNVGTEIGLGPQAAASNVWVQRIISVIMGGAVSTQACRRWWICCSCNITSLYRCCSWSSRRIRWPSCICWNRSCPRSSRMVYLFTNRKEAKDKVKVDKKKKHSET